MRAVRIWKCRACSKLHSNERNHTNGSRNWCYHCPGELEGFWKCSGCTKMYEERKTTSKCCKLKQYMKKKMKDKTGISFKPNPYFSITPLDNCVATVKCAK